MIGCFEMEDMKKMTLFFSAFFLKFVCQNI